MINNYLKLMNVTMKKWILFMFAFAGFAFAACSGDDALPEGGGETGGETKGDAWVSLKIGTPTSTRAINDPNKQNGDGNESKITTAKVIFFKYTGGLSSVPLAQTAPNDFLVVDVVDLSTAEIGNPGQQSTATRGDAFKVSKEVEYLLFVANPPTDFPAITKGLHTFADVNSAITTTVDKLIVAEKFMMTNAKGDLEPSVSDIDKSLEKLTPYATKDLAEATDAPVELTLDRVVSKVRVYTSPSMETNSALVYKDLEWVLNVTNKRYYPVSERTATFKNTGIWSNMYGLGTYRKDPNYNNTNPKLWDTSITDPSAQSNYAAQYNYLHSNSSFPATGNSLGVKDPSTGSITTVADDEYCLENTQDKDGNMHAYTTQVLLKGTVNPKQYLNSDGTTYTTALTTAHDWIKIGEGYYTPGTLKDWMKKDLENGGISFANAVNIYLQGLVTADPSSTNTAGIAVVAVDISTPEKATETITAFEEVIDKVVSYGKRAATHGTMSYYAGGTSYYKIMIKHDNDGDSSNNELGEFGVVRNSVYDVVVNSINNAGYPTIPDPDPNTPDEENEYYLSVLITINPWTWYSQVEDL